MNKQNLIAVFILVAFIALSSACGGAGTAVDDGMKKIMDKKVDENITVTLSNSEGKLKNGEQELTLAFTDGSGKPVEINAASLNFNMPAMGSMSEMNDPATLTTTSTPGKFKGKVKLQMPGEWIAQISYEGEVKGKTTMKMTAY